MSIFSQQDFIDVQEVIKIANGQNVHHAKKEPVRDELAELNEQGKRIQSLVEEIDTLPDEAAKNLMQECMQEVLSFYGHGLERILKIISSGNSEAAKNIYNNLIEDNFISSLLLIHDLHPLDLKTRLLQALQKVKPYMDSHGGSVEIVSIENGIAKLKLAGHCNGCPSSASTLELGIKEAIEESCPDLLRLEVEGVVSPAKPLSENGNAKQHPSQGWKIIDNIGHVNNGSMKVVDISGTSVIICRVDDKLYAYRNVCPACGMLLNNGKLEGAQISCNLGHRYEIKLAGKCSDDPDIHLEPFPLLEENGIIKMAVS